MNKESCHYCVPERAGNIAYSYNYLEQESNGNTRATASQQNLGIEYRPNSWVVIVIFRRQKIITSFENLNFNFKVISVVIPKFANNMGLDVLIDY